MDLKYTTLAVVLIIFVTIVLFQTYDVHSGKAFKIITQEENTVVESISDSENAANSVSTIEPVKKTSRILTGRALAVLEGGNTKYYHNDHLSSISLVTDETGNELGSFENLPFGTETNNSNSTENYKYTGKEQDGTGLYYYGARLYDTTSGRFLTSDPILRSSMSNYAYSAGSPLVLIDEFGMAETEANPDRGFRKSWDRNTNVRLGYTPETKFAYELNTFIQLKKKKQFMPFGTAFDIGYGNIPILTRATHLQGDAGENTYGGTFHLYGMKGDQGAGWLGGLTLNRGTYGAHFFYGDHPDKQTETGNVVGTMHQGLASSYPITYTGGSRIFGASVSKYWELKPFTDKKSKEEFHRFKLSMGLGFLHFFGPQFIATSDVTPGGNSIGESQTKFFLSGGAQLSITKGLSLNLEGTAILPKYKMPNGQTETLVEPDEGGYSGLFIPQPEGPYDPFSLRVGLGFSF